MKRRILILENKQTLCDLLTQTSGTKDHEAVWIQTAREGLRRSLDEPFDLLLLDPTLSDMDVWEALDWFHKLHPFLPVVLLIDRADQAQRGTALGAEACLEKPLNSDHLLQTISRLLAESQQARMSRAIEALYAHVHVH